MISILLLLLCYFHWSLNFTFCATSENEIMLGGMIEVVHNSQQYAEIHWSSKPYVLRISRYVHQRWNLFIYGQRWSFVYLWSKMKIYYNENTKKCNYNHKTFL